MIKHLKTSEIRGNIHDAEFCAVKPCQACLTKNAKIIYFSSSSDHPSETTALTGGHFRGVSMYCHRLVLWKMATHDTVKLLWSHHLFKWSFWKGGHCWGEKYTWFIRALLTFCILVRQPWSFWSGFTVVQTATVH